MVKGLDAGVIGTAQVERDVYQGIVGFDVGVYGEERWVAGIAAAEGVGGGVWEGGSGTIFLVMATSTRVGLTPRPLPHEWVAAVHGVVNRGGTRPGRLESLPRTAAIDDSDTFLLPGYHTRSPSYSATVWSLEASVPTEKVMAVDRMRRIFL